LRQLDAGRDPRAVHLPDGDLAVFLDVSLPRVLVLPGTRAKTPAEEQEKDRKSIHVEKDYIISRRKCNKKI
jgi:hypothetical protein